MFDPLRLQAFLREVAAPGRTVLAVDGFAVYLHPRDPLRFLNYAIPDGDVDPDPAAVQALRAVFQAHERLPRLEWVEEAAPRLAPALAAAAMIEELRAPLMALAPDALVEAPADVEGLTVARVGAGDLRACADVQRVAFGQARLGEAEEPAAPSGGAVLARSGRNAVSAASWTSIVDGVTEIAGVATAEPWRGRGLAGAVTAAAARAAFADGAALCILSPGDETGQRVYARAGFRRVATMLHWSD